MPNALNEVLGALGSEHEDDLVIADLNKFEDAMQAANYQRVVVTQYDPEDGGISADQAANVAALGWASGMHRVKGRGNEGYDVYINGVFDATYGTPDDSDEFWLLIVDPE